MGTIGGETWDTIFPQIAANVAPDGSFVVSAAFNGVIVLGEGESNETVLDSGGAEVLAAYVARFDTAGSLVAARQLSTPLLPVALAVTPTGEIVIAGFEDNPLPGISLTKLTADGDELWSEHAVAQTNSWPPPLNLNADNWEEGPQSSIRLVSGEDGALVLAGNFEGDIVVGDDAGTSVPLFSPWDLFDDGTAVATAPSHFLAGFAADGALEWARAGEFTGEFTEEDAYSGYNMAASQQLTLAAQANGDILIVGAVLGSLVSENADGTTTALDDGCFTAKYDAANGDQIEVIPFDVGSNGSYVEFQSAAALPDGTAVIAARYSGALAFMLGDGTEFDADGPYSLDGAFLLLKTCADGE